jgi:flagellar biosynthesis component FlhA
MTFMPPLPFFFFLFSSPLLFFFLSFTQKKKKKKPSKQNEMERNEAREREIGREGSESLLTRGKIGDSPIVDLGQINDSILSTFQSMPRVPLKLK